MKQRFYKYKKTGNLYSVVTNNFMFKDFPLVPMVTPSMNEYNVRIDDPKINNAPGNDIKLDWRRNLILYKAEYYNPDGQLFARMPDDFYKNFEPVIGNVCILKMIAKINYFCSYISTKVKNLGTKRF